MYIEFYKLSKHPFQLTPDAEMLFVSEGHKNALAYFHYGLLQGEGFVVLTGNSGVGKTTLIKSLLKEISADQNITAATITAANLDGFAVLETISSSFGLKFENKSKVALMKGINDFVLDNHKRKSRALLIVDEAQTLLPEALEELRLLSNLENKGKSLMQIFLVGQQELTSTLLSSEFEQLRQRIIASYHLSALSEADVKKYIEHRLYKADWQNDPAIHSDIYKEIYRWSSGIPRKINLLCDRLFLYGFTTENHKLETKDIEQVILEIEKEMRGSLNTEGDFNQYSSGEENEKSFSNISLSNMNYKIFQKLLDSISGIETSLKQLVELYKTNQK
jgi:general secretion pathway protein A